jgi:phage shock protein PspC (stress-responsive transcriptional regulator)
MSAVAGRAPLRRASGDRLLLGVCAGIASSLGLAPLAIRLGAVALAAVAAPLVLGLYVVIAAIVPRDDGRVLLGGAPADRRESLLGWGLIGLTLIWFAGERFVLGGLVWPALSSFGVFAAASGALVLLALAQRREVATAVPAPSAAETPAQEEPPDGHAPAAEAADQPQPDSPDTATEETAATLPFTPPAPRRPPRRGPSVAVLGFGALLIAGAAVFLLDAVGQIDLTAAAVAVALGAGAALAGAGAIAGALTQRRGVLGLLALGVVLGGAAASVALLETELDDGIGLRTERPRTVADIPDRYRLGAGELDIDLRDTELPAGPTTIRARVGAGELDVYVPAGVRVESVGPTEVYGVRIVNAALRPGKLPENKRRAAKERRARARAAAARPLVRIDADVLEGDAEVIRVGG